MNLIVIGHAGLTTGEKGKSILSAQSITKSGYSGVADEDEEELEIFTLAQKMYGRLFAPDSILVRGDDDVYQARDLFPHSSSRVGSSNDAEISMQKHDPNMVELDNVGLTQWGGSSAETPTNIRRTHLTDSHASSSNLLPKAAVSGAPTHSESPSYILTDAVASSSSSPPESPVASPMLEVRPPRDETLQSVCKEEFGGDWKAMLQATAETITTQKKVLDPKFKDIVGEIWSILDTNEVPKTKPEPVNKTFRDHVVILCSTVGGSELLLDFLRFSSVFDCVRIGDAGILIMSKDDQPERMKDLADPRLTFIQGDPTNNADLERCFINVASKIIILSNPYFSDDDREGADSSTIMTHLDVHKLAPKAQIFTELVHEPNLKFFRKDQQNTGHPAIKKRVKINKEKEHFEAQEFFVVPEFASGQVCTLSTLDSLICQIHYQEHIAGVAKGLVYGVNSVLVERGGLKCRHIPVGEEYHGRRHSELYTALLSRDMLPLALYRCTQMTGAPLPYVFTCPPPDTILHELDSVLVLERDHF